MTKNFDTLLKNCLTEMQAAQDPSKDPLFQGVVANMNNPALRKVIEDALKKIEQTQAKQAPQQNQQQGQQNQAQTKPTPQPNQPQGQQNQQQQPNNAANKPA